MRQISEERFKKIKKGDNVKCLDHSEFVAGCDAFRNSDADEKGWEIESEAGTNYSIDGIAAYVPLSEIPDGTIFMIHRSYNLRCAELISKEELTYDLSNYPEDFETAIVYMGIKTNNSMDMDELIGLLCKYGCLSNEEIKKVMEDIRHAAEEFLEILNNSIDRNVMDYEKGDIVDLNA